jgi:hypothetical protein
MHPYIRMHLSALAPSPSRPGHQGRHLRNGLIRRAVSSSAAMCRSRGSPPASSSPLGAYSSPAAHHITPHNLTSPLYFPLSTYILFSTRTSSAIRTETRSGQRASYDARAVCISLTCAAVDTRCRSSCRRVRACAAPTWVSRQT